VPYCETRGRHHVWLNHQPLIIHIIGDLSNGAQIIINLNNIAIRYDLRYTATSVNIVQLWTHFRIKAKMKCLLSSGWIKGKLYFCLFPKSTYTKNLLIIQRYKLFIRYRFIQLLCVVYEEEMDVWKLLTFVFL